MFLDGVVRHFSQQSHEKNQSFVQVCENCVNSHLFSEERFVFNVSVRKKEKPLSRKNEKTFSKVFVHDGVLKFSKLLKTCHKSKSKSSSDLV